MASASTGNGGKIMEYLEKHDWATEARAHYKDIFIDTYLTKREKSRKTADKWFKKMLRKHSDFFSTYGIMDAIPEDVDLPRMFWTPSSKASSCPRNTG